LLWRGIKTKTILTLLETPAPSSTVFFVCSGNTCRSPIAERLLRHALDAEPEPLKSIRVASFGTSAFPGSPASENAVYTLSKVGINLKDHRSQSADDIDIDKALAFFCMTRAHQDVLLHYWDVDPGRVFLVREWIDTPPTDIIDPFGMDVRAYHRCRDSIVEAIPSLLGYLRKTVTPTP